MPRWLQCNSTKYPKENQHQSFMKSPKVEENFPSHFIRPVLSCYQNKTKTSWGEKKTPYRPIPLMNTLEQILNLILASWFQQHMKKIIHHDQVKFASGMYIVLIPEKSICVIHHINRIKNKKLFPKMQKKYLTESNILSK